jgi:hypothetical protein
MAVLKGKLSWSMAAWLFAWLGLAVIPRLRVSPSSVKLLQASTDPSSSLMWFTRDVTVDRRLAAVA